jgi:hypothetical protein
MEIADAVADAKNRIRQMFPDREVAFKELWAYRDRSKAVDGVIVVGGEVALPRDLSRFRFQYEFGSGSTLRVWFDGKPEEFATQRSGGYRFSLPDRPTDDGAADDGA